METGLNEKRDKQRKPGRTSLKEKGKEKLEEKVGKKVIHTGAVWMPWSEEAEMRFRSMLLQFLMPVCQH